MKTICTLDGKIIMSQDGEALETMELNAAMYEGSKASVVTDEVYEAMVAAQPLPKRLFNAPILAELDAIDRKSIRALREGNATRITQLEVQATELRKKLQK